MRSASKDVNKHIAESGSRGQALRVLGYMCRECRQLAKEEAKKGEIVNPRAEFYDPDDWGDEEQREDEATWSFKVGKELVNKLLERVDREPWFTGRVDRVELGIVCRSMGYDGPAHYIMSKIGYRPVEGLDVPEVRSGRDDIWNWEGREIRNL